MARSVYEELPGREGLIRGLWQALGERNLIMSGPRRVGKSSMLKLMARHPAVGFALYRADLQGCGTVEEAFQRIYDVLPRPRMAEVAAQAGRVQEVSGVKLADQERGSPWDRLKLALLGALKTLPEATRLVVALDEVPFWLDELERDEPRAARLSLAQLRYLRQHHALERVRWILTGSVGLAGRAIAWEAAAELNDLDIIQAPPLDESAGRAVFEAAYTERMEQPIPVSQEACAYAHRLSGGRPHWIKQLAERVRPQGSRIDVAAVQRAEASLLSREMRHLFRDEGRDHFRRTATAAEAEVMEAILTAVAEADRPLPRSGLLAVGMSVKLSAGAGMDRRGVDRLLLRLADEYYLTEVGPDSIEIAMPLFGRWWALWRDAL